MTTDRTYSSDVAFTPTVKAIQARKGSRGAYGKMEEKGGWQTAITPDLKTFIEAQISIFLATANAEGQPYIQHRGGPPGFLRVLDELHSPGGPIEIVGVASSRAEAGGLERARAAGVESGVFG